MDSKIEIPNWKTCISLFIPFNKVWIQDYRIRYNLKKKDSIHQHKTLR